MGKLSIFRSRPFPVRGLPGHNPDTREYIQPRPSEQMYLSYWQGNQLPGVYIQTNAHPTYMRVPNMDWKTPQLQDYGGGPLLGQMQVSNLLARMRAAWSNATPLY